VFFPVSISRALNLDISKRGNNNSQGHLLSHIRQQKFSCHTPYFPEQCTAQENKQVELVQAH
jgi:hypothetical protein